MVNVNKRETGLREHRRAYGGVVNVSSVVVRRVADCAVLIKQNLLATGTSKEGDWRIVDGKIKQSAGGQNLIVERVGDCRLSITCSAKEGNEYKRRMMSC
jgi:hypothetical protein